MSYYDTIEEDLARAKEILTEGRLTERDLAGLPPLMRESLSQTGGTIFGKDTYAAYKLLESFVAEIERLRDRHGQEGTDHDHTWVRKRMRAPTGPHPEHTEFFLLTCVCGAATVFPLANYRLTTLEYRRAFEARVQDAGKVLDLPVDLRSGDSGDPP